MSIDASKQPFLTSPPTRCVRSRLLTACASFPRFQHSRWKLHRRADLHAADVRQCRAYVGEGTMIDSQPLVGSCAQVGRNCTFLPRRKLCVLEPVGALPVIIEDEVLVAGIPRL